MDERTILDLLSRVRSRWRRLAALRAVVRAALAASLVFVLALLASRWTGRSPLALALIAIATILLVVVVAARSLWPLRRSPSDRTVARFIEEAEPDLDDRLASATAVVDAPSSERSPFAEPMLAEAARRASSVDPARIVPRRQMRLAVAEAAASVFVLAAVTFSGRAIARQSIDAVSLSLFPSHVSLQVAPGNTRIKAGTALRIDARLTGNTAPVAARLLRSPAGDGDREWRATEMNTDAAGTFHISLEPDASFVYKVNVGTVTSPAFTVTVARPPRVARIDLEYTFPKELGLAPRTEEDTGDIYAPSGTDVRVVVHADRDAAAGRMTIANGRTIQLKRDSASTLSTSITVEADASYRVALSDAGGLTSTGDTEYFIRTLQDRPPDVHVLHPARDREVTRLEEVDIQARADDDFGVASMDLVYSINGGPENDAPFAIPSHAASATGMRTLFLEDLKVAPGDFVSYYVRARDIGRGKKSTESRSDLFFLQVRPFDQEFTLASTSAAGANSSQVDDLVQAQKDVVVSTWKLDRRAHDAGATPADDIRFVAKAEHELKTRVEEAASSFGQSTMRDPRARGAQRSVQPQPGEGEMAAAAAAMAKAASTLDALKTSDAVPPEMEALNHLLQAQAEVKQRQVQLQQAGNGNGQNRSNVDLSNLFDRELQRQQRTNYETTSSAEQKNDSALSDKIRDLARRQDELNERQKELARRSAGMPADEMKRELDKLTRDQAELRQQAEELSAGSTGSTGSKGSTGSTEAGMRSAADAMNRAASSLRQQNPGQASQQGQQASDRLRSLADQMSASGSGGADARRRALGDMQLEARQMADAQRQISSALESAAGSQQAGDAMRRLAGEEESLAARTDRVQQALARQAAAPTPAQTTQGTQNGNAQALAGVARDFERQRESGRMQQAAAALRDAASGGAAQEKQGDVARTQASAGRQIARDLDRLADRLAGASAPQDEASRQLSASRARAEELRTELDRLSSQIATAASGSNVSALRDAYAKALQQSQQLLQQMQRDDPSLAQAGAGFTFEGQGMVLSSPGTEAFKQDFAKWEQLRMRATDALSKAETTIDRRLEAKAGNERLASSMADHAPAGYESQVNSYFKALADNKR